MACVAALERRPEPRVRVIGAEASKETDMEALMRAGLRQVFDFE